MTGSGESVLVIDDEPIDADTMYRILTAHGFRVYIGYDYDDALTIFQLNDEIELLIVDISLPGRSGLEIASELLKRKPSLRVLFVSGYVGAEVIRFYGVSTSDVHFLRKPFQADELVKRIAEVLKSSEPMKWLQQRPEEHQIKSKPYDGDS
jgi:DNA-binding response OmpR family regulator